MLGCSLWYNKWFNFAMFHFSVPNMQNTWHSLLNSSTLENTIHGCFLTSLLVLCLQTAELASSRRFLMARHRDSKNQLIFGSDFDLCSADVNLEKLPGFQWLIQTRTFSDRKFLGLDFWLRQMGVPSLDMRSYGVDHTRPRDRHMELWLYCNYTVFTLVCQKKWSGMFVFIILCFESQLWSRSPFWLQPLSSF